jgi:FkbM family methyltransferase
MGLQARKVDVIGIRSLARTLIRSVGYQIIPTAAGPLTMDQGLASFAPRFPVNTVIDVGASNGCWTELCRRHYPQARYLLVEAQADPHEPELRDLAGRVPGLDYVIAAAGDRAGTIHFDASDPFGGIASDQSTGAHDIEVPVTTVDAEVAKRGISGPYLLKLDTHGFEVPILEGARQTLRDAALLVVEVYNFKLGERCLRFFELCAWMEIVGFRPIGMVDLMYRPKDGALWQFDCFFARLDRPEFQSNRYGL